MHKQNIDLYSKTKFRMQIQTLLEGGGVAVTDYSLFSVLQSKIINHSFILAIQRKPWIMACKHLTF